MNHDDMARLLPAERDLPAARKQILKEHLMTELRRADSQPGQSGQHGTHRTKRPRRMVLVTGAVLTAAAVAIATAVAVGTHTSPANSPVRTPGHRRPAARQDRHRGRPPAHPGRAGQRLHVHPQRGRL